MENVAKKYNIDFDSQKTALGKMAKSIYEQLPEQSSMISKNKHRKYTYNRDKEAVMLSALFLPLIKHVITKNVKNTDLINQGVYLKSAMGKRYINDHRYHINVKKRYQLQQYLIRNGVDAKVHYPIPIHLQPAAKYLKYKRGDFPIAEKMANTSMSLPVHEFIKGNDIKYVANLINKFY